MDKKGVTGIISLILLIIAISLYAIHGNVHKQESIHCAKLDNHPLHKNAEQKYWQENGNCCTHKLTNGTIQPQCKPKP